MSIFVIVVAAVLALLTFVLYRRLAVAPDVPTAGRWTVALVLAVMWGAALAAFAMQAGVIDPHRARWLAWAGMTWLVAAWYLLLGTLVLGFLALLASLASSREPRRRLLRVGTPAVVVAALGTTAYGLHEAAMPTVTPVTFTSRELPEGFDGLRVALVTDLHVGPVRDASFTQRVVDEVNAQKPDVVVLGGDLVDGKVSQVSDALAPLADLKAPLGVFAVSGNHEFISQEADAWLGYWEKLGITVLRNENVALRRQSDTIRIAGVHDETGTGADAADIDGALGSAPAKGFTILVAHQPQQALDAQQRGIDLQLSGHTHGGQVWPFRYAVRLQQPVIDGLNLVGDVPVLTSRGAGAWGPPVRVLAPPEIPLITLRRG
ncbi:MAG TPA: metallophosphoesterase [Humibacillus sp.]|nr:metallophosphoesterase [Humibacillus sp.]